MSLLFNCSRKIEKRITNTIETEQKHPSKVYFILNYERF